MTKMHRPPAGQEESQDGRVCGIPSLAKQETCGTRYQNCPELSVPELSCPRRLALDVVVVQCRWTTHDMHPLTELACGDAQPTTSSIGEILSHLSLTLDRLIVRSVKLRDTDDQVEIALFGPVMARALLEVAFTALLGRLDPFRVLLVREFQKQPSYVVDRRSGVAFNWQPDVQGEKVTDLFKADLKLKDVTRALLGPYYQEAFWREACQCLLDTVPFHRGADWMSRLRLVDPETFASRARGESERIYTICSKGVHHEFVVSPGAYYDKGTIHSLVQRSFELIGMISITANMCQTLAFKIPANRAIDLYEEAQRELVA